MNIEAMRYSDAIALHVPSEVIHKGLRRKVTYRTQTERGGTGMGEYPASVMIVLNDGTVWKAEEWAEVSKMTQVDVTQYEQQEISF